MDKALGSTAPLARFATNLRVVSIAGLALALAVAFRSPCFAATGSATYAYDALGRVVSVTYDTGMIVYLALASAHAACPTFPYSFSNGSTADANQVNANFNNVITCFAPLANPSFTGNVGIGTSTPVGSLMIQGTVGGWSTFNFGKQLLITGPAGNNPSIGITDSSGNNPWAISNASGLVFSEMPAFSNSTSPPLQRVVIKAGGNVGIGTTTPSYTLQVNGTAAGSQAGSSPPTAGSR